eukprot:scaffold107260_cov23-Tisochrysis_lutea.AAC.1
MHVGPSYKQVAKVIHKASPPRCLYFGSAALVSDCTSMHALAPIILCKPMCFVQHACAIRLMPCKWPRRCACLPRSCITADALRVAKEVRKRPEGPYADQLAQP